MIHSNVPLNDLIRHRYKHEFARSDPIPSSDGHHGHGSVEHDLRAAPGHTSSGPQAQTGPEIACSVQSPSAGVDQPAKSTYGDHHCKALPTARGAEAKVSAGMLQPAASIRAGECRTTKVRQLTSRRSSSGAAPESLRSEVPGSSAPVWESGLEARKPASAEPQRDLLPAPPSRA